MNKKLGFKVRIQLQNSMYHVPEILEKRGHGQKQRSKR